MRIPLSLVAACALGQLVPGSLLGATPSVKPPSVETLAAEVAALRSEVSRLQSRLAKEESPTPGKVTTPEDALAKLRALAEAEAGGPPPPPKPAEETVYQSGGLGLQGLNPEISVTGDLLYQWADQPLVNGGKSDFDFRNLGLHIESYLDPYTRFKAAVPVTANISRLGEAYLTRYGLKKGLNLTLGQFRQQFGVVNRWHLHGLDQTNFPLPLRQIFGDGDLASTGLSLEYTPANSGKISHEWTLQITDGDNGRVFGENDAHRPSALLRYRNYRDLDDSKYFEFGLTGLWGENDRWQVGGNTVYQDLDSRVLGFDFSLLWEPTDRMRYRNRVWRGELYHLQKDILMPAGGQDGVEAWGFYTYLQEKVNRTTELGLRYDFYKPDTKGYATAAMAPLATNSDAEQWALIPYVTYYQSPFVHYRLEFQHLESRNIGRDEDRATVQVIFAAGPHKHDRY